MTTITMQTPTKDAETPKRCEYRHNWVSKRVTTPTFGGPEGNTIVGERELDSIIACSKCNHRPGTKKEREEAEAIVTLKELLKPGDTVYTTLKHVSRSGMQRAIDVHIIRDNEPRWIASLVAKALGWSFHEKYEAVKVDGCGMDMGFHLVHSLSYVLYRDYECPGEGKCHASYHQGKHYRDYTTEKVHKNDGYALVQKWL